MIDVRRHRYLTEPGQALVPLDSLNSLDERNYAFSGAANLDTIASVACSVPLPAYDQRDEESMRWAGLEPELIIHPLFWLPQWLVDRQEVEIVDGQFAQEDDDELAARIAVTMTASMLYDPETGTWLDVLSTVGLDINDPSTKAAVAAWLAGGANETLDRINLDFYLTPTKQIQQSIIDMAQVLVHQGLVIATNNALHMLDDVYGGGGAEDLQSSLALFAGGIAELLPQDLDAIAYFSTITDRPDPSVTYELLQEWLISVRDESTQGLEAIDALVPH